MAIGLREGQARSAAEPVALPARRTRLEEVAAWLVVSALIGVAAGAVIHSLTTAGEEAARVAQIQSLRAEAVVDAYERAWLAVQPTQSQVRVSGIGGVDAPLIWKFEAGFEAGARAVRPDIEVRIVYLRGQGYDGFNDPEQALRVAPRLYRKGADVIYHAAGDSGWGLFRAAYEMSGELGTHMWAIGVDSDQYQRIRYAVGEDLATAWREHILTSMMKRADTAVYTVVAEDARGVWNGGVRWFGLAEGGVDLAYRGGFIDDIRPELDRLRAQVISGEIEVPVIPSRMGG